MARREVALNKHQALALLYVLRWSRYRRSQHVLSRQDKEAEFKRLAAKKRQWAQDGKMPLPAEREEPDYCHLLRQTIGSVEGLDPTPQEAFLTLELAIRIKEFKHIAYLDSNSRCPWSFFKSNYHPRLDANRDCLGLLVFLAYSLSRFKARPEDL